MRTLLIAAATLFASTQGAFAQDTAPSALEASRALIENAQMSDIFTPVEHESPAVRHNTSGLTCHFFGAPTRMQLATFAGQPRGDDVGCVSDYENKATTLYATRYTPPISLEEALAGGVAGIRHRFPDAQPLASTMMVTVDGAPVPRVAQFTIILNGERWFTSVIVAESNGWIYKLRYTSRAVEDESLTAHELEAGAMFALMLGELSAAAPE